MSALHVFDMDGTLLRGTSAPIELSRRIGRLEALQELERGFAGEEITATQFAVAAHAMWGDLTAELVAEIFAGAPWIDGIEDVCADIARRGERSMLITMSPNFFADLLGARGIDVIHAAAFPPLPLVEPIDPARILNPTDKVRLTEAERVARDLPLSACVAYGDSMSDLPLFAALENTVAVNADERLERVARAAYRGNDLREAYAHGRAMLDAPASPAETGEGSGR